MKKIRIFFTLSIISISTILFGGVFAQKVNPDNYQESSNTQNESISSNNGSKVLPPSNTTQANQKQTIAEQTNNYRTSQAYKDCMQQEGNNDNHCINWGNPGITVTANEQKKEGCKEGCCGIRLNTDFPFIGKCIGVTAGNGTGTTQIDAFPRLAGWLMKLIITIIMVISVLMIVAAGVMMTTGGYDKSNYTKGVTWIKAVAQAMALLWASGVILKLINPNFFR